MNRDSSQIQWPMIERGVPALVLAPMEGIIDAPMREVLTQSRAYTFCVSEFLRVSQTPQPAKSIRRHIPELIENACNTRSGTPVQLQLLGGDPECIAKTARKAVEIGVKAIDLNFGCPAKTVNRNDGGATLLRYPLRIRDIVRAVRNAVPAAIPVSAKLRLGWETTDAIFENAMRAEEGGASWIAIHARTKTQGYRPPAHWRVIKEVRSQLGIPVIANGEIWTLDDFKRCQDETHCEHFMLGRGALGNPYLAITIARELGIKERSAEESLDPQLATMWIPWFELFSSVSRERGLSDGYAVARMKKWANLARIRWDLSWFDSIKDQVAVSDLMAHLKNAVQYYAPHRSGKFD